MKEEFDNVMRYASELEKGLQEFGTAIARGLREEEILRARVADLESRLSSLDCRYAGGGIGEVSGSHCPADAPCDRCVAERRVAELEAYQRNAGIWMAELIEKIDRYEGALRRVSVPVGESTLDARIAIATNALTA